MRRIALAPLVAALPLLLVGWMPGGKNLQHFPKDMDLETLKGEMKVMGRSLGVECSKCHVTKPERDFAAETDKKKTALFMLEMTSKMQDKVLTADFLGRRKPIQGSCYMCHQGKFEVELKPKNADDEKRFNEMAESPRKQKTVDGMKKLVEAINKDYFTWKDAPKATCWMCHRGKDKVHTKLPKEDGAGAGAGTGEEKKPEEPKADAPKSDNKPDAPKPDAPKPEDPKSDGKGPF